MVVRQYRVGSFAVFSYLIGDEGAGEGLFIDPSDDVEMLVSEAEHYGLRIKYVVNTHCHIDHIMGNSEIVRRTGAKIVIHERDAERLLRIDPKRLQLFEAEPSPPADILVKEGDVIRVGRIELKVIHTPGHSPGCISLYTDGMVFTGDPLFVGSVGRTDFPDSSFEELERSIKEKLYVLPEETIVFPGHHYGPSPTSTIGYEKSHNPFVRA